MAPFDTTGDQPVQNDGLRKKTAQDRGGRIRIGIKNLNGYGKTMSPLRENVRMPARRYRKLLVHDGGDRTRCDGFYRGQLPGLFVPGMYRRTEQSGPFETADA